MRGQLKFERLMEPGHIGSVKTKNRLVKSAAGSGHWNKTGNPVSEKIKYLFEAFARGGIGLIIIESSGVRGIAGKDSETSIKQMSELTGFIHKYNCPVFVQLSSMINWKVSKPNLPPTEGSNARAPSAVCVYSDMDNHNTMPRQLTIAEIQEIAEEFIMNSVAAQKAGYDGVEINSASTHLLHTFLSPFWNKRQDEYGCQNMENRTRFITGVIREIKKRAGQDFAVSTIINGIETGKLIGVDDSECLKLNDAKKIAKALQDAGADAVQVRSQWISRHDSSFLTDHLYYPETPIPIENFPEELDMSRHGAGSNTNLAAAVKSAVSIPVITVGRLDPILGEQILRDGKADFIAMTRRLFADPELPNKLASGRYDEIAPCTSCTHCKDEDAPRRCRINAAFGGDRPYVLETAAKKKTVVVVGGGPGGMEAARVAATRGHKVILYEKTHKLGGLIPLAAMVKGMEIEDLPAITRYLKSQMVKAGVDIRMGKEFTADLVDTIKPDVVILASGGIPVPPDISGIENHKVVSSADLHKMLKFFMKFMGPGLLRWLTNIWMPLGKKVIVIGGGIQGCELAEFLVKRGRKVTIVDEAEALGKDMIWHLKLQLFWWFDKKGVTMMPGVTPLLISDKGLTILKKEGYKSLIEADNIVPAVPMKLNTALIEKLKGKVWEVYAVGDCNKPGLIVDAIADGWKIANSI